MFLQDFLKSENQKILTLFRELEKNWSSQEQVYYKLAPEKLEAISQGLLLIDTQIRKKPLRQLNSKEKFSLYVYLRIVKENFEYSSVIQLWLENTLSELEKLQSGSEMIRIISQLDKVHFNIWIHEFFLDKGRRRIFFSSIYGKKKRGQEEISLYQRILKDEFGLKFIFENPRKPKPKVFRKGYRDHGSLGSDQSKLNKEISWDVWFQQKIKDLEKQRKDTLNFIIGMLD